IAQPSGLSQGTPCTISAAPMLANPSPSVRYLYERSAISLDGNCAISTDISSTVVQIREALRSESTSNSLHSSVLKYFIRLSEARLQAVLSRNIYSEHGLLPFIGPSSGQVCHSLIVS